LWTPGYWAYGDDGYFWVPGVWVLPPQIGFLWTPAYWGYADGIYVYHAGYWGPHVGFYGGVNYGYGYWGNGFAGGRWEGRSFRYNTAAANVNTVVIHNTYVDRTVIKNNTSRTSFNGGPGGISARPNQQELAVSHERHVQATTFQSTHIQTAARDRNQYASANNGRPSTTAMNTVGGHRYDPNGKISNEHTNGMNAHAAQSQHAMQPAPTVHNTNHPSNNHASEPAPTVHNTNHPSNNHASEPAPTVHNTNHPSNNHSSEVGNPNQSIHHNPPAMEHQQAYDNHQHYQQHDNPHPQQQHNPVPAQHREGGSPHPKEH
jgi:hypothetical protein